MKKKEVYVLELDGVKLICRSKIELIDCLKEDLDIEKNNNVFKIYSKEFTEEELEEMSEFDGF